MRSGPEGPGLPAPTFGSMILNDVRYALRRLLRDRSLTVLAAAALALGIGANTTIFTVVNAVLIRGLPYDDPHRIVNVSGRDLASGARRGVSLPDFEDLRGAAASFSGLAAFTAGDAANLSDAGQPPERVNGSLVTPNTFRLLGQPVLLGRDFLPAEGEPGAPRTVILGHRVWQDRYAGDPGVLGRVVRVNDEPATIVGVMPEGMRFPVTSDLWRPLRPTAEWNRRDNRGLSTVGRLAPGAGLEAADAEVRAIAGRLRAAYPDTNEEAGAFAQTFNEWANGGGRIRLVVLTLMGAVVFVLLIACANVANLLLARSAHRAREVALRVAQGATRWQVVRQLLIESLVLGVPGGAAGLGLGLAGTRLLDAATQDVGKPWWMEFTADPAVVAFLAFVCVGTSLLFGLTPALHVSRTPVAKLLQEGGRSGPGGARARRLTAAMVVAEVTLAVVLLSGAGLMMRSFQTLYRLDLGFDPDRVLTGVMTLTARKHPAAENRIRFMEQVRQRLDAMPGVRAAAFAEFPPLGGGYPRTLEIDGRPAPEGAAAPEVVTLRVGERYFESLDVPLLRGRALTHDDGRGGAAPAVVVNERFAARFFPGADPLGRRIRLRLPGDAPGPWLTVVGLGPNVRQRAVEPDPEPVAYLPYRLRTDPGSAAEQSFVLQVLTTGPPAAFVPQLREAVRSADPDQPVFLVQPLTTWLRESRWSYLLFSSLLAGFAVVALVLSAVGIYSVTAYSVAQRTQEIGVRMALGALRWQVVRTVMRRTLVQVGAGLALGVAGGFAAGRLIESLLVQVSPVDPATLAVVLAVLAGVTAAACVGPARRAAALDPVAALRSD